MFKLKMLLPSVAALTGCATIPDVTYNYYAVSWRTVATVTRTLGCNAAKTELIEISAPTIVTSYTRDQSRVFSLKIKDLEGTFADAEIAMSFTDDGRLKDINQSSTGQGEAIAKAAVSLITTFAIASPLRTFGLDGSARKRTVCDELNRWGDGKPVTLTYVASIDERHVGKDNIPLAGSPEPLYELLRDYLPVFTAAVSSPIPIKSGAAYELGTSSDVVELELQRVSVVTITTTATKDGSARVVGSHNVTAPQRETYRLPIPKPALFGKQTFKLGLSDAGRITSIGYGKLDGTAGALNALSSVANSEAAIATAKAAELKAQADIMAQQQRLVLCTAKPADCK